VVHHSRHLAGSPEQVVAALNDPELILEWVTRLKAVSHEWRTDKKELPRTELRFSSDLSRVPPPISTFVGDTLDVIDRRAWRRARSGTGFRTELDVAALTAGKGGVLEGSLVISREEQGSSIVMDGKLRLSGVPRLLAGTLRGQVEVLVVNVLIEQLDLAQERLVPQ
jgi:hypothetical protein